MVTALLVAALVTQATTFRVDPAASEAGFDLKATGHTVHGKTTAVAGEVAVTPGPADALELSGKISIDAGALETGNRKRDATMHGKSLLTSSFPTIDFEPRHFEPKGAAAADGTIAGTLTGTITIRGQARAQSMAAELTPGGGRIVAKGTFDVTWAEFGIPDPSFFVVRIEKAAHAHFRATFVPVR